MQIVQTRNFQQQVKKLHTNQKRDLDNAVKVIAHNPLIGEAKKGELSAVRVYKFKMVNHLTLLAYRFVDKELQLILLAVGSHENFYRDLSS